MRRLAAVFIVLVGLPALAAAAVFDPAGWTGYQTLAVTEAAGVARKNEPVEVAFVIPGTVATRTPSLRLVEESNAGLTEVTAQFFELNASTESGLKGKFVILCSMSAKEQKTYRLYFGHPTKEAGRYESDLSIRPAEPGPIKGPMHWIIENRFYRVETYPKNGQVWHLWDKAGTNQMWWFKEWNEFEKGGDPIDWSPNVWVAYPDRVRPDPNYTPSKGKIFAQPFDWHYVVGWNEPKTEIISGPIFHQIRRSGPVPPHPDHTDFGSDRPSEDIVRAEVTYRFYAGLPWYFQSSVLETLADMDVYFIRNGQMVFNVGIFSHLAIRPQTLGLRPGDRDETAFQPLMSASNRMPFGHGHSLSNILPSKLGYYTFFNPKTGDGYANIPLLEKNSAAGGQLVMRNHAMSLSEGADWLIYFGRTFNYTNRRFNPENVTALPKGHRFEEANAHLIYGYKGPESIEAIQRLYEAFNHPLVATWISPEGGSPSPR